MVKEKLTIEKIKIDLKRTLKKSYRSITVLSILFVILLLLVIWLIDIDWITGIPPIIEGTVMLLLISIALGVEIIKIVGLYAALKNKDCIVKDKLVGFDERDVYAHHRGIVKYYYLYFSQYGEYCIPDKNYEWSKVYPLSKEGVFRLSKCGDEFYLVLSKKHTGKILMVYNTKLFDFED